MGPRRGGVKEVKGGPIFQIHSCFPGEKGKYAQVSLNNAALGPSEG